MSRIPPKQTRSAKPTGRAVIDERGVSRWEWRSETGSFKLEIDTQRLKALSAGLSCDDPANAPASGANPYDAPGTRPGAAAPVKRRSLDDMRRLSEEIKARQAGQTGQTGQTAEKSRDPQKK